jgi:hypothetical protein
MQYRHIHRAQGGAISLLLTLLVIGLLAWFALRSTVFSHQTAAPAEQINCVNQVSALINRTHGIGADYQAGYEALPGDCKKLAPPPTPVLPQNPGAAIGTVPDPTQ